jgi:hypothetical protein
LSPQFPYIINLQFHIHFHCCTVFVDPAAYNFFRASTRNDEHSAAPAQHVQPSDLSYTTSSVQNRCKSREARSEVFPGNFLNTFDCYMIEFSTHELSASVTSMRGALLLSLSADLWKFQKWANRSDIMDGDKSVLYDHCRTGNSLSNNKFSQTSLPNS